MYETPDEVSSYKHDHDSDSDSEFSALPSSSAAKPLSSDVIVEKLDANSARSKFKGSRLNGAGQSVCVPLHTTALLIPLCE